MWVWVWYRCVDVAWGVWHFSDSLNLPTLQVNFYFRGVTWVWVCDLGGCVTCV